MFRLAFVVQWAREEARCTVNWPTLTGHHPLPLTHKTNKSLKHQSNKNDLWPATHCFLVLLPTVIVCCHGNAGIAQASLLGEDRLWHGGHIDDVSTPLAEHQALCPRRKPRPLDSQHGPSHMTFDPQTPRHLHQNLQGISPSFWNKSLTPKVGWQLLICMPFQSTADKQTFILNTDATPMKTLSLKVHYFSWPGEVFHVNIGNLKTIMVLFNLVHSVARKQNNKQ